VVLRQASHCRARGFAPRSRSTTSVDSGSATNAGDTTSGASVCAPVGDRQPRGSFAWP
jgi:hypothetical protein